MFNLEAIKRQNDAFMRALEMTVDRTLVRVAGVEVGKMKAAPPYTNRSGALSRSVGFRILKRGRGRRVVFTAKAPHATYLEHGTPPHMIMARGKKALRFYSRRAGKVVFAKFVKHPGTKPTHFLSRTRDRAAATAMVTLNTEISALAKRS